MSFSDPPSEPICTSLNELFLSPGEVGINYEDTIPFNFQGSKRYDNQDYSFGDGQQEQSNDPTTLNYHWAGLNFENSLNQIQKGLPWDIDQVQGEEERNRDNEENKEKIIFPAQESTQIYTEREDNNIKFQYQTYPKAKGKGKNFYCNKNKNFEEIEDSETSFPAGNSILEIEDTAGSVESIEGEQIDLISNTDPFDPIVVQEAPMNYRSYDYSEVYPEIIFSGPDLSNSKFIRSTLEKWLLSAKNSIKVWNYSIGYGVLSTKLLENIIYNLGGPKKIQIITDKCQWENLKKYCERFGDQGVEIRTNTQAHVLMHWKFMIIDNKILIHGSMNLGNQSMRNFEHFTISKDKHEITEFKKRFNKMWDRKRHFSNVPNQSNF